MPKSKARKKNNKSRKKFTSAVPKQLSSSEISIARLTGLLYSCPKCNARPGESCTSIAPSDQHFVGPDIHEVRLDRLAEDVGKVRPWETNSPNLTFAFYQRIDMGLDPIFDPGIADPQCGWLDELYGVSTLTAAMIAAYEHCESACTPTRATS